MNERRLWTAEEDSVVRELVGFHGCNVWTVVASEMGKMLPKSRRSSKQIRERWHNHVNPQINKTNWTEEEEQAIFSAHKTLGSKWKQIAKLLVDRTDNAVKNHFYSTIRRSLRRINKYFGFKNSTQQMRNLKPVALSCLLENTADPVAKHLIEALFTFTKFKPTKHTANNIFELEDKRQDYANLLVQIELFSKTYRHVSKSKQPPGGADTSLGSSDSTQLRESGELQAEWESMGNEESGHPEKDYFGSVREIPNWFEADGDEPLITACIFTDI